MMFSGIDLNSLLAIFHVNLPGVPELPPPSSPPHFIHTLTITRPLSHIITSDSGACKQAGPSVLNTWALRCLTSFKCKSRQATLPCFSSSNGSQCPDSMKSLGATILLGCVSALSHLLHALLSSMPSRRPTVSAGAV